MNKIIISFAVAVTLIMGLIACEKSEALTPNPSFTGTSTPNTSTGTTSSAVMTADVDGNAWSGATISASIISGVINVTGVASDQTTIIISLLDTKVGTYDIEILEGSAVYQISLTESYNAGGLEGEVVVSEIDAANKTISGTFRFKGVNTLSPSMDTVIVTNGVFTDIPYLTELPSTGGGSSSLEANVSGNVFTASTVTGILLSNKLRITGSDNMGQESIGLSIPDDITPGTYMIGSLTSDYYAQYNQSDTVSYEGQDGRLTITKHDVTAKEIEGTFDFAAFQLLVNDSVTVSAGKFKTTY